MEKLIRNLLVLTGAIMGVAVACTPLTSYAVTIDTDRANDSGNTIVNVNVDGVLEITAMSSDVIMAFPDVISNGTLDVTVRSAMPYTISLSAEDTFLTDETESHFIPARSELTIGKVGWGIKKVASDNSAAEAYTAIQDTPVVFYDSDEAVADDGFMTQFPIGVTVNNNTPRGTYTTTVTALAAIKQ